MKNLLFLLADQFRSDALGTENPVIQTPNLNQLAEKGARFTRAYTPLPVCAPARQSMLTGVQPDSIGALFNYNFLNTRGADPAVPTWVSELKDAGYRCAFVGHWDASPNGNENAFGYETYGNLAQYNAEISAIIFFILGILLF